MYGFHPVAEALRSQRRRIQRIYLDRDKAGKTARQQEILRLADQHGVDVQWVCGDDLDGLAGHRRHQGVTAEASSFPFCSLEEIVSVARKSGTALLVLVLDQILDPHNLGAMARTALCSGVHGMVITRDRSAQPTAACSKVSAGAIEHVRIASVPNLVNALKYLKKHGLWIAGADRYGTRDVFAADLSVPLALVIGGEEKGLRPLVKRHCDFTIAVPQADTIGSLNASVSAGIIMYEVYRQRHR